MYYCNYTHIKHYLKVCNECIPFSSSLPHRFRLFPFKSNNKYYVQTKENTEESKISPSSKYPEYPS